MLALPISVARNGDEYGSLVDWAFITALIISSIVWFDAGTDSHGLGPGHEFIVVYGLGPEFR